MSEAAAIPTGAPPVKRGRGGFVMWLLVAILLLAVAAIFSWAWSVRGDTIERMKGKVPQAALDISAAMLHIDEAPKPETALIPDIPLTLPTPETEQQGLTLGKPAEAPARQAVAKNLILSDPALLERGINGKLPIIDAKGREPWKVYAAPAPVATGTPRIALIVTELGLNRALTESAVQNIAPPVAFAFSPYAQNIDPFLSALRAKGHEFYMLLPMEPANYPINDPGPNALLTTSAPEENLANLLWAMSRAEGYVGLLGFMGGKFTANESALRPILQEMKKRGVLFADNRDTLGSSADKVSSDIALPHVSANIKIDGLAAKTTIDSQLRALEEQARTGGFAIGIITPSPAGIERINLWMAELEKRGLQLTTVSSLAALGK